ncbi:MAG: trigger factor [Deltaproteobacteria bacterium]
MKVNMENLSGTQRKVDVVIPVDEVKQARAEVFNEISKSAKIKGFRPGKAPANVIESAYKNEILSEVATRLVTGSLESALKEVSAAPITRPQINPPEEFTTDKDFEYSAVFEVLPEFDLAEYKNLPLKKEVREVSDEDVEHTIKHFLEHKAEIKPYQEEKSAEKDDVATVDFEGFLDGGPVKDLKREGLQFVIGEEKVIPEFEQNVIGMKKGEEKEFDVAYGEDFQIKEAAGKTVRFKFKLAELAERIIPELNDEIAKELGKDDVAALKDQIKEDLKKQSEDQGQGKMRQQLVDLIVERNTVESPESLVKEEAARLARNIAQRMQQQGLPPEAMDDGTKKMIGEQALRNVKASIVLGEIAKIEGITVTEEDVNENLSAIAASYNVPPEQVREIYQQNNLLDALEANLAEQKVIDFIIENAEIEEVPATENHVDNKEENQYTEE